MEELLIRKPDDFHVHLRQGSMMPVFATITAQQFARALVMPNTDPPIQTGSDIRKYRGLIRQAAPLEALMSIYLTKNTKPETIAKACKAGAVAAKFYPQGATTNSTHGIKLHELHLIAPALHAMEDLGMILCLHGEDPDAYLLDREKRFLPHFEGLCSKHPKLRIVLEHVSSREGVEAVKLYKNAAATVTVHHLILTMDNVVGQNHHHCMPCAKSPRDRDAILEAVCKGLPQFFFGSDSAPHPMEKKHSPMAPAGVFSSPIALPLLAQTLELHGALNRLEDFTSRFGAEFYGLPRNSGTMKLVKKTWTAPSRIGNCMPFYAGRTLDWTVE